MHWPSILSIRPLPRRRGIAVVLLVAGASVIAAPDALTASKPSLTLTSPSTLPPNTPWTLRVDGDTGPPQGSITYVDVFNQSASQACASTVDGEQTQKLQTVIDHHAVSGAFHLTSNRRSNSGGSLRFCGYLGSNLTGQPPYASSTTTVTVVPGGTTNKKHKKPKKCAKKKFARKHKKKCHK